MLSLVASVVNLNVDRFSSLPCVCKGDFLHTLVKPIY
jgi:hypothetical protein